MRSFLSRVPHGVVSWAVKQQIQLTSGQPRKVRWLGPIGQSAGQLVIGDQCIINCRITFDGSTERAEIGDRCVIGASQLVCREQITIGNNVIIS